MAPAANRRVGATQADVKIDIVVVDYGMGNLGSVINAFERLGARCRPASTPEALAGGGGIVLPGVGAFHSAMQNLKTRDLIEPLTDLVMRQRTPFLGVCLGMQLVASESFEGGRTQGLGWVDGRVVKLSPGNLRVPHVGWNEALVRQKRGLFAGLDSEISFYFDHSFALECDQELVTATCEYGGEHTAAIQYGNIQAVQFHPEKSQRNGLRVLRNFLNFANAKT